MIIFAAKTLDLSNKPMKNKHLCTMLLIAFFMPWAAQAQTQGEVNGSDSYCDDTIVHTVTNAFSTDYSVPFEEKFTTGSLPEGWKTRTGLLSEILNGGTLTDGSNWGWFFASDNNSFGSHPRINICGTDRKDWLITPNIRVEGCGNSLSFHLALTDYYCSSPAETTGLDDKFVVLVSTDDGSSWSILRQWDNAGSYYVYNDIATNGESVYINLDGFSDRTLCIAFYGESTVTNADNNLHIDNVSIDATPTCYRPGFPAESNVTNHSATLTWTAGEAGQTAWQIAYKKGESFDPNAEDFELTTVNIVDVNALTYTFDKTLDAYSTYYVYVRANCGSEYSKWCNNYCKFTTKKELLAPKDLTVANVMPTSLDLGWTVGGGDFEESWDIIYSTSEANPAPEAIPNFVGVTENPYHVTGLQANTGYYFWVRANHTGYSPSIWSTPKYQYTPEACQKPSGLTAGDATPNSIKLSWTAGAAWQTAWTVAYSEINNFDPADEMACQYVDADTNVFVVDGLDPDETYYFRVKGNCGYEYGESEWNQYQASGKTLVSCPKPTNLAANNLTFTTADLTWTGYSDSYTVQIREGTCFFENFDNGMPADWDNSEHNYGNYFWEVGSTGGHIPSNGTQFAYFHPYVSSSFVYAYLITPAMNLSASGNAFLSFSYVNAKWANGQDELHVYYRVDNDEWTLLKSYTTDQPKWTVEAIELEGLADNYQIGFYGKNKDMGNTFDFGYGIGIDNVRVFESSSEIDFINNWSNVTTEATNGAYTLTGLTKGTIYDVRVVGNCVGGVYSDVYTFATPEFMTYTKEIEAYDTDNDKGWYLMASPLEGETTPDAVTNLIAEEASHYALYRFNENPEIVNGIGLEWENYKSHQTDFKLVNGHGYLYANSTEGGVTLAFTGTPLEGTESVGVTLQKSNGAQFAGWNLVGNPFTDSAYIGKPFYTMNEERSEILGNEVSRGIAPMEGVFVWAESNGETLTFSTTRPESNAGALNINVMQAVANRGNRLIDRAILSFGEGQTLSKFQLNENSTKVYIPQNGKDYAVVSAEVAGEMPLNFRAEKNGSYTLSFSNTEVAFSYLHLIDNMTGADIDLLETSSYTFNAKTTDYESRFKLVFATGSSTGSDTFAFYSNGNWVVSNDGDATLQVIDVNGRILSSERISGSCSKAIQAAPGVYMLRLINGDNVKTQKVVVR